nr:hypothetical protein [Gordonia soli]
MWALVIVAAAALASATSGIASAAAPSAWDGQYSLKRFAATKTGTSLAARQPEPDFADTYTFVTTCTDGRCVATVVAGPTPENHTLPRPPRYTWEDGSWVHRYDWEWDCYQGPGKPKIWAPAHSLAVYTPRADGTLDGVWRTEIDHGPCAGTVIMAVAAYPVDRNRWTLS